MTKARELELLEDFIQRLEEEGKDGSYLAPWLRASRPSIEQAIRNDVSPSCYTMNALDFQKHLDDRVDTCRLQCEAIVKTSNDTVTKCEEIVRKTINEAYDGLRMAMKKLEDFR